LLQIKPSKKFSSILKLKCIKIKKIKILNYKLKIISIVFEFPTQTVSAKLKKKHLKAICFFKKMFQKLEKLVKVTNELAFEIKEYLYLYLHLHMPDHVGL
jgi:hypothetical protein